MSIKGEVNVDGKRVEPRTSSIEGVELRKLVRG
jgi:hypothetical protein